MTAYDFDLFVIGGGSGGVRCARIAAGPAPRGHRRGALLGRHVRERRLRAEEADGACRRYGTPSTMPRLRLDTPSRGGSDWADLIAPRTRRSRGSTDLRSRCWPASGQHCSRRSARWLIAYAGSRRQAGDRRAHRHRHRRPSEPARPPRRRARHAVRRRLPPAGDAAAHRDHRRAATSRSSSPAFSPGSAPRWT